MNHKQIAWWALIVLLLTSLLIICCLLFFPQFLLCTLFLSILWNLLFACMLYSIHHMTCTLCDQLMKIYTGHEEIDLYDQQEGVFSVLKNDIYKLIRTYYEQKEQSLRDRKFLADTLNDISHQIKTPLTSMQMMSELLACNLSDDKRKQFSEILQKQLNRLHWLVSSLLKLSQLDICAIPFHRKIVALDELVRSAMEPIQTLLFEKKIYVHIETNGCMVETDEKWTREALLNILKNAAEHTPENGTITIMANKSPLFTSLIITDNGEGMDLEDQAHLFERFYRGKSASCDSVGIGMAMTKAILQAQQADIQVQSELGKGTKFNVLFHTMEAG